MRTLAIPELTAVKPSLYPRIESPLGAPTRAPNHPGLADPHQTTTLQKNIPRLVTLVFTVSFFTYFTDPVPETLLVAPLLMILTACYAIAVSSKPTRRLMVSQSLRPMNVLVIFAVPFLATVYPLYNLHWDSVGYAVLLTSVMLSLRIILATLRLDGLIVCLFQSSLLCVPVLLAGSFGELRDSLSGGQRYSPFFFHPNLLAFIIAGYCGALIVASVKQKWVVTVALGFAFLGIPLCSSSRGALAACAISGVMLLCVHWIRLFRRRPDRLLLLTAVALFALATAGGLYQLIDSDHVLALKASDHLETILELNSPYRGLNTGLSGRWYSWEAVMAILHDRGWVYGHGTRSSDREVDFPIDNGYLVAVYDLGLVGALIITGRFVYTLAVIAKLIVVTRDKDVSRKLSGLWFFGMVFLANNFVARYLFGVGNPVSLAGLCLLLVSADELISPLMPQKKRRSRVIDHSQYSLWGAGAERGPRPYGALVR